MVALGFVQGKLLEAALSHLLQAAGYWRVNTATGDRTLCSMPNGLGVVGRGSSHQIDAIGDFFLSLPFSARQRLLGEAKFHQDPTEKTGIEVIRNAVGVLKDVSEFWSIGAPASGGAARAKSPALNTKARYHYQYAVISSTSFSPDAQAYAFVHDIALIQVARSRYFRRVLDAIRAMSAQDVIELQGRGGRKISQFMTVVQASLDDSTRGSPFEVRGLAQDTQAKIQEFVTACREIRVGLLATGRTGLPIFLAANPDSGDALENILLGESPAPSSERPGRIKPDQDGNGWIIEVGGEHMFSFDMPINYFKRIVEAEQSVLDGIPSQGITFEALLVNLGHRLKLGSGLIARILPMQMDSSAIDTLEAESDETEVDDEG